VAHLPPTDLMDQGVRRAAPRHMRLEVVEGPDRGRVLVLERGSYVVGKAPGCELILSDGKVSRRHLEVTVLHEGVQFRDLGSTNGSFFQGARFDALVVGPGSSIFIGATELAVIGDGAATEPATAYGQFGPLHGASDAMNRLYDVLARVAPTDIAVLIQGETGTGKELAARAIHAASSRAEGPFVVCDVSALPRGVLESELFGHVRGAFSGAHMDRDGAFVDAYGGTLFLDEIGELVLEAQPILLRVLEQREVKPVGGHDYRPVDVRVVAATNRDLAAEVKAGRFRQDLYHRVAVVPIEMPALRHRRDDIPMLVEYFIAHAAHALQRRPPEVPAATLAALQRYDWPGNIRELKNVVERACALATGPILDSRILGLPEGDLMTPGTVTPPPEGRINLGIPFRQAKQRLIDTWEREYVAQLLQKHQGNVSEASRSGGIDRVHLYRLLRKHGLWSGE
jgi:two-component system, NtrC family, nitrogen regulation response regulator GlnG